MRTLAPPRDELLRLASPAPGRPDDIPWIVGDPGRFVESFGFQPQRISLNQTVADAIRTG